MTRIRPGSFLTLHYRLAALDGADVINTFGGKPATLSLGTGQLSAPLEQRLIGLEDGARASFDLPAGEAFGERNPALVQRVSRSLLRDHVPRGDAVKPGEVVQFPAPDGRGSVSGLVREAGDTWLLCDFNHPLAGQAVRFEVQVLGVID